MSKLDSKDSLFIHVIILGYTNFSQTSKKCLDSIVSEFKRQDVLFTVIDNGSPDDAATQQEIYATQHPNLNSVVFPDNLGFAGGMNFGANLMPVEWVLLLGSDTIFSRGAFEILYSELKMMSSDIGIVGPVTNEAGTSQMIDFSQKSEEILAHYESNHPIRSGLNVPLYRADFFCVAIRKSLWDQLNGLSLSYGRGYYEDFDFCMRAKALGYCILLLEDVFVYHQGSASFKQDPNQKALIKNNKKIFMSKFPKAQLRHRRLDNLMVLNHYLNLSLEQLSEKEIQSRIKLRFQMADNDNPRSFWKKWIWKIKVKKVRKQFEQLGFNF
ncbi:hypothetical protein PSHI8_02990 [Polynucleobacter sp. SHI8]|uniref:glycosyltransferase family 2 protein n=1 Tax=unclassified Polynucleobacter TaxID=2640945 RepID=UPI0024939C8D|nr:MULTISPECIES: glycosyltransferase [unclassified Polynucleobacter]BDW10217.1 hypothetical protein PSHI2_02990 [Polynucleobacter sp. SHI2]BDW12663.1 hypothetical protein PSHI8_02990 [Polynucleobacter sp. SHI8]